MRSSIADEYQPFAAVYERWRSGEMGDGDPQQTVHREKPARGMVDGVSKGARVRLIESLVGRMMFTRLVQAVGFPSRWIPVAPPQFLSWSRLRWIPCHVPP